MIKHSIGNIRSINMSQIFSFFFWHCSCRKKDNMCREQLLQQLTLTEETDKVTVCQSEALLLWADGLFLPRVSLISWWIKAVMEGNEERKEIHEIIGVLEQKVQTPCVRLSGRRIVSWTGRPRCHGVEASPPTQREDNLTTWVSGARVHVEQTNKIPAGGWWHDRKTLVNL